MFRPRIIPCLLLANDGLVKTIQFSNPVYVGDPINAVKIFNDFKADELIFLDITATPMSREPNYQLLRKVSDEAFMPFSYGGGIRTLDQVRAVFDAGAEKVILNSACYERPELITQAASIFGNQAIVIAIDARKNEEGGWSLYSHGGRRLESTNLLHHVRRMEELGAGELFVNSIDRDGTRGGYDLELIARVAEAVNIPVIACGGANALSDFKQVTTEGNASAASAGSYFVFVGSNQAVLINYPDSDDLQTLFDETRILRKHDTPDSVAPATPTGFKFEKGKDYKICRRCVIDSTDPHLHLDKQGICNHCRLWEVQHRQLEKNFASRDILDQKISEIKQAGQHLKYDCIIGVSGGTDSTYLAYLVKREFGLRPLAVHLDNGWNSKLATRNINNIVQKLSIDLHTHVIDWEEFKNLQLAYLRAGVLDIELLSDHAIFASLYDAAERFGVAYVLPGLNPQTEMLIPKSWSFNINDLGNILDINQKHGTMEIKTFPTLSRKRLQQLKKSIKTFLIFNYWKFDSKIAKSIIQEELGWVDYGGKHYESIFTRFYQGYILPVKFKVDKRRAHYSALISMGMMTREEAIEKLREPTYDPDLMREDYDYVVKKLGLTPAAFEEIIDTPPHSHFDYRVSLESRIIKQFMVPTNPVARFLKEYLRLGRWGIGT
jgi:imidazoleglycerol phosphate synthase cyclase subunit